MELIVSRTHVYLLRYMFYVVCFNKKKRKTNSFPYENNCDITRLQQLTSGFNYKLIKYCIPQLVHI